MAFVRSISGIRGTLSDGLTPEVVCKYVSGFSELFPSGCIVVGYDGRPSGKWIENLVVGTLLAMNRKVIKAGIVPTPAIQILVEEFKAVGGISITASHNPENWNGFKFIKNDGTFLSKYENQKLFDIVDSCAFKYPKTFSSDVDNIDNTSSIHINSILKLPLFQETNILKKIQEKNFKVVIDANNASGSVIIPELLRKFGCEVIVLNCSTTGRFAHPPEPTPDNIKETAEFVKNQKADIGFVVDPDADRLVLINEKGEAIWEELTIVLAINAVGEFLEYFNPKSNKVVVNYSTTQTTDFISKKYGLEVLRAPVGEINVVQKLKEVEGVVGGEGSGGVILPFCHYGRDSLVGISLILSLLAKYNKPISEIVENYPKFYMKKNKIEVTEFFDELIEDLVNSLGLTLLDVISEDGYRFQTDFGWIHIRKSNTEPIARIIYETSNFEESNKLSKIIYSVFGKV